MQVRRFAWVLLATLWVAAGCKHESKEPGMWVACTCPYLTDFDDVAKHQLEVCVPAGTKPEEAAYGCASQLTHGPAEPCTCAPPTGPCDGKELCRSKEYK